MWNSSLVLLSYCKWKYFHHALNPNELCWQCMDPSHSLPSIYLSVMYASVPKRPTSSHTKGNSSFCLLRAGQVFLSWPHACSTPLSRAVPCPLPYLALRAREADVVDFAHPATVSAWDRTSCRVGNQRIRYSARCRIVTVAQRGVIQRNELLLYAAP